MRRVPFLLHALLIVVLSSCATKLGSTSLAEVRGSYNEAVAASTDEQMLLNIVRLRHLHSIAFLQVSSVTTQYTLTTNVGVNGSGNIDRPNGAAAPGGTAGGSAGLAISERPTITYAPLQGPDFVRRLATPLSASQVVMLIESGWGADLVLGICVRKISELYAPGVAGGEGSAGFDELGTLLRKLQLRHELSVLRSADEPHGVTIGLSSNRTTQESSDTKQARRLLGLGVESTRDRLSTMAAEHVPDVVAIQGRSVLDAMFYLSQGVQVPEGRPGVSEYAARTQARPLLVVRQSKRQPKGAYVTVQHQDRYFYIEESDLESKRTFSFLTFLFNLTSMPSGDGPLVTLAAGGG